MNKSLNDILNKYPNVKKRFNGEDIVLTNEEDVFYQLALFVNDPNRYSFNTNLLYKYLTDLDLIFALKVMVTFFQKDTFLIQNKKAMFIDSDDLEKETLYNQTTFSKYLIGKGLNFPVTKITTYNRRGKLPKGDIIINGTPYWYESTVELFAKEEKKKEEQKTNKK